MGHWRNMHNSESLKQAHDMQCYVQQMASTEHPILNYVELS